MKKLTFLVLLVSLMSLAFANQEIRYEDPWGSAGFSLMQRSSNGVSINFSIDTFTLEDTRINGEDVQNVLLPGNFLQNDEGMPNLPGNGRYIAIPQGSQAELRIINSRTETFYNVELAPAPRIPLETEDGPLEYSKNRAIYNSDEFYPANPIQLGEQTLIRGVDAVMVGITPFQYNPATKELIVYRDLELEVNFIGGNSHFGADNLRSRWWDPIMADTFLNHESLPVIDYSTRNRTREGAEYLIICPDDPIFLAWADSIKTFRNEQGISTVIKTVPEVGGNTPTAIENYINGIMNPNTGWDPAPSAILLLGDYGTTGNTVVSPIYNNYCVSDNIYADVSGNMMPDVILARMTAQNETHLHTMITKFLNYERTPPTNPDFYDHPITALGWQTERWFQICSEAVGGYFLHEHGKSPVRINAIYSGTPGSIWSSNQNTSMVVNYFGPNGQGYIPQTPAELGGWTGGTATMVNNAINSGAFILQHRDHGYEQGWGEPAYSSSNINSLTNTDLPFVFSINCLTGKYNLGGECFVEKFHRHTYNGQNSGALGCVAPSEVSYSFVNDAFVWGMYDNMWPDFMPDYGAPVDERGVMPAFGNAAGKYFLQQSAWPYNTNNKAVTYALFHHHGDAFTTIYSEVPQNLTVTHDPVILSGMSTYNVTADDGALIALSVEGVLIGVGTGTGSPVAITIDPQIPPTIVKLVITKQNYYRYESSLSVIPPGGPYVVFNEYVIDDATGNGDGLLDYSETVNLDMTVNNVGSDPATNVVVTITSADDYITILDGTENFGTIAAGAMPTIDGAFQIEAAGDVPDGHVADFVMTAVGEGTWVSYFSIEMYAPILATEGFVINDATGGNNNGRLDPGETVTLYIPTSNEGSSASPSAIGVLTCSDPLITIDTATYTLGVIAAGGSVDAVYTITADASITVGSPLNFMYGVVAGEYTIQTNLAIVVGLILEDFESNSFNSFEWEFGGNGNWTIATGAYEGTYCGKSGTITHNQTSSIYLEVNVLSAGDLSFFKKVSSENNYDYLRFYVDNNELASWAGEVSWSQETYAISAGTHILKWEYDKDVSVNSGSDCAWIDYIIFPPISMGSMGTISGLVTDNVTGLPIQGVDVNGLATTLANGTYSFDITPGTYDITFNHEDYYELTSAGVAVMPEQITSLDVSLVPLPDLDPPNNFAAAVQDYNDVLLTWELPGGASEEILYHSGYDNNGIGTNGVVDFICCARFTAAELANYYGGWSITGVNIFLHSMDFSYAGIKVYEGGSLGNPGTVVYDQDITSSAVALDWTNHLLTTPVPLVAGNEYWIGYDLSATADHPAAVDMGPMVPDKGAWMFYSGAWDTLAGMGLDYNWVITGIVSESDAVASNGTKQSAVIGSSKIQERTHALISSAPFEAEYTRAFSRSNAVVTNENSRALVGYTIYRDGTEIEVISDPATMEYLDTALDAGTYDYEITANYDEGESDPAGPVEVLVVLPAPTGLTASSAGLNITVQWMAPTEARDLLSYTLYKDGSLLVDGLTATFYVDTNVGNGEFTYEVCAVYDGGYESELSDPYTIQHTSNGGELIPLVTELEGNYPNPFNPTTSIKFAISEPGYVTLEVYNIKGEKVRTLVDGEMEAKFHSVLWDGQDNSSKPVSSGVYFYKMKTGKYTSTKKMILMK